MRCSLRVALLALVTSRAIQLAAVEQKTEQRQRPRLPRLPPLPQLPPLPRLEEVQECVRKVIEAPRKRWIAAASEARTESGGDAVAFVKMLTGETLILHVETQTTTVKEVKDKIQGQAGIPSHKQRLICRGKQLEDGLTLEYYNIRGGDTMHVCPPRSSQPITTSRIREEQGMQGMGREER